jgi:hypothetical protein
MSEYKQAVLTLFPFYLNYITYRLIASEYNKFFS